MVALDRKGGIVGPSPGLNVSNDLQILVVAPTSNDALLTTRFLEKAGLRAVICSGVEEICGRLEKERCGAVLLAEEALTDECVNLLVPRLQEQPSWSDLPLIILSGSGEAYRMRPRHLGALGLVGNVSMVERPVRPATLVSVCEVALRSRHRQYQVRDLVEELSESQARLHSALESLVEQANALKAADRRKDEFLAMLAHELRNPLAAVANAAALLKSPDVEEHAWASEVIERQSGQLAHLIDDLLDVSRITTGKIRLRREIIDAGAVLDRARDLVRPLMAERGHTFSHDYVSGNLWIEADPTRMEQIVLNLLTNAAKYTPAGGRIELTAGQRENEVLITVRDNGIGVAPQLLPEMFQLFAQGERSIARSEGGLGIGLTIVQRLVEMHGGRVEAYSEGLNRGSIFTIHLPLARAGVASDRQIVQSAGAPLKNRRVLIVDDNVDTAEAMARLLSRAGHTTSLTHDGPRALERALEFSPEAVLLDIGLPGMDGFEVAKRLRQECNCADSLLVAVTGYGQPEDRQRAMQAGFDHHFVKPVDIEELKKLLITGVHASNKAGTCEEE